MKKHATATRIATIGIMSALATGLMFLEFPIFPFADFLKYDPSDILALLAGFTFGIPDAIFVLLIKDLLFYILKSADIVGILMNFAAGFFFIVPTVLIYRIRKNRATEILGYVVGVLVTTGVMLVLNMIVVPFYWKISFEEVVKFLPWIAAFNAIKFSANSIVNALVRRRIEKIFE